MKTKLTLAGLTAATILLPAAHAQMTGTSHPEQLDDTITASQADAPHYVKPSPAVRYADPGTTSPVSPSAALPSGSMAQTYSTPASEHYQPESSMLRRTPSSAFDPDANIVTSAPATRPGELGEGTLLRARLQTPLSTRESQIGNTFLAELVQPVTDHGVVLLPVGSQIKGRVSEVHGGRRIGGPASIRLQPDTITLPDGSIHRLYAQVVDLDNFEESHVNSEGTIVGSEHPKATLAALGLTTGSATVAGAMIGGGVGAVVGAGIGASAGTIWWLKRDLQQQLPVGTGLVFSLNESLDMQQQQNTMAQVAH